MRKFIYLALVAMLITAGCESYDGPTRGEVVAHKYDDPDDWTTTSSQCVSYDSDGACSISIPITNEHHDGPHWYLRIDDGDKADDFEVDERTYHEVRNGQWFDTETGQVIPR